MDTPYLLDDLLDHFGLTSDQRCAAAERQRDVTVTAGAGSGKTRTLVARYLGLLSEGRQVTEVLAITFTEKAAREMRTRVRGELRRLALEAKQDAERAGWIELEARMDSARVGTIHSLCAEILRTHPAEAGLDPQFGVVDDNEAAQLRAAAVETALVWAVGERSQTVAGQAGPSDYLPMRVLFDFFTIGRLKKLLSALLARRLDVEQNMFDLKAGEAQVLNQLQRFFIAKEVQTTLGVFHELQDSGQLKDDAGDKLADQIATLLTLFDQAESAVHAGETLPGAMTLWRARCSAMGLKAGKHDSQAKEALRGLREYYDLVLEPWLGSKKDNGPDEPLEEHFAEVMPLLGCLYDRALADYRSALREQQALDFDDLEAGALALLNQPHVAARWQAEIKAVLVDEFQDTNERQRQIVLALCGGQPGKLFVVGDARQSIYRFRGADVTVFTSLQQDVRTQGGLVLDLDRTFRAHPPLLDSTGSLLAAVMGTQHNPGQPFRVPFEPLVSQRSEPRTGVQSPYLECVLGSGANSDDGRRSAATALAGRLAKLRSENEIDSWNAVTLLFRASTGFYYYETAFEAAGIPFVTVAGSGFYDRPEVRDLLNALRALADPWDDLVLAGFLRSPLVGLSDAGLYQLRYQGRGYRSLRQALENGFHELADADRQAASLAKDLLDEFVPWVDRLPVAELLRQLIARSDLRAILAASPSRLWRNVDKLLADARASGLVRVRAFLDYLAALRDVGAREGEAVAEPEAGSGGAVRLMTIHKSKGLEFPVVVLADAGRRGVNTANPAYPLPAANGSGTACWTAAPDRIDSVPLAYQLAKWIDGQQADAESGRLLYVAMTRAQEKLIVSGHLTVRDDGRCSCDGWLQALLTAGEADVAACLNAPGQAFDCALPEGGAWRLWLGSPDHLLQPASIPQPTWPDSAEASLAEPLIVQPVETISETEPGVEDTAEEEADHVARILGRDVFPTAVGRMVHQALRRWSFDKEIQVLESLLTQEARQAGLRDGAEIDEAMRVSTLLLARFRRHPLWNEVRAADECYHALPCCTGEIIDVMFRNGKSWTLVDFYTGSLRGQAAVEAALEIRRASVQAKRALAAAQLGVRPAALLCFLDAEHQVQVVPIESATS